MLFTVSHHLQRRTAGSVIIRNLASESASSHSRKAALLAGLLIGVYYVCQARFSLAAQFTHDDLMNCWRGVFGPLGRLVADCVVFFRFSDAYRPFGALVYRAAFAVSGFDLGPLRLVLVVVMGLNIVLVYCFARRLSASREAGILAALLGSYHLNATGFYYNTGQMYDIWCFFFYFCALVYYVRIRQTGRLLRWYEFGIFCALYVLALDSKELAVSLPVIIGAYELFFKPPSLSVPATARWTALDLLPMWVTAIMTAAFVRGRVITTGGLPEMDGYRMAVSLDTYLRGTGHYLNDLFYAREFFDAPKTLAFALVLLLAAVIARSRSLGIGWLLFFAGILPMAFIGSRGLPAAWIPLAGLFIYAAAAAVLLRNALLKLFRRWSWKPAGPVVLFVLAGWFMLKAHHGNRFIYEAWQPEYTSIRGVREDFARLCPAMPKGASVLIAQEPLNGTFSIFFLVQLLYRDSTSRVQQLFRFDPKPDAATITSYDYVFGFENGKVVRLDPAEFARQFTSK